MNGERRMRGARAARALLLAGLTAAVCLSACRNAPGGQEKRYSSQYFDLFDTVTVFTAYAPDQETFDRYDQMLYEKLEEYHRLCDLYHEYDGMNNVKTINDNAGVRPVKVDERLLSLLEEALRIEEMTGGAVNVAMGSVLSIWHDYREAGIEHPQEAKLPPDELLREAALHMDPALVLIDREASAVYLEDPAMSLDLGAVAKGYAAEQVCRELKEAGLESAMLNVGGNVRVIGSKPGGEPWSVGIQDPDADGQDAYLYAVDLTDGSLVTSGTYQRYYMVEGVRCHHIIHPQLLRPWDRYVSVTVLCADSGLADGLSTGVFNMEPEEGKALIESMDGVEVLWIYPDGTREGSSGFPME